MDIRFESLNLKMSPNYDEDCIEIYTDYGLHDPLEPLGHRCILAILPCSDIDDEESTEYQLARLFINSPALFESCKGLSGAVCRLMETYNDDSIEGEWIGNAHESIRNIQQHD